MKTNERGMEMDELKLNLSTRWMRGIITKLISKAIFKKTGYKIDIRINNLEVESVNGKIYLHADLDAETTKEEFIKITKSLDLD